MLSLTCSVCSLDARQLFLEEIMDWTDYYCENQSSSSAAESDAVFTSIVQLWIQYAQFEISLSQFKKAVEVFDKATNDAVCQKSLLLYQTYAKFCVGRKKPGNAQNVYILGLCAGLRLEENVTLWSEFLALMHSVNKSDKLTVEELYDAVRGQDGVDETQLAVPQAVKQQQEADNIGAIESKEQEGEEMNVADDQHHPSAQREPEFANVNATDDPKMTGLDGEQPPAVLPAEKAADTSPEAMERRYAAADDLDDVAGYTPEQLIRTFCARPPMLFTALHKVQGPRFEPAQRVC
jgi:hypothetical protein